MDRLSIREYIITNLKKVYTVRESDQISKIYLEDKWPTIQNFSSYLDIINKDIDVILKGKPIQYVTGKAFFYDRIFMVDENTLIPRPETEELVHLVIEEYKHSPFELKILDIGTGSGCIPIILSTHLEGCEITSIDINVKALEIARKNNNLYNTHVNFKNIDFLDKNTWNSLGSYDIIISNPPYISEHQKTVMSQSVLQYEPQNALFPPGNDPLIFYRLISEFANKYLKKDGSIYLEINEFYGQATQLIFNKFSENLLIKDMQNKDRILKVKNG